MDGPFGFMDLQYIQIHYKVLYPLSKAFQEKRLKGKKRGKKGRKEGENIKNILGSFKIL